MVIRINTISAPPDELPPNPKKSRGHTKPAQPLIDLNGPGRIRVAHVLALFGISHSTLYARMRVGQFPARDGLDGRIPYWHTSTIRAQLNKKG